MKDRSQSAIQYSGYPLAVIEKKQAVIKTSVVVLSRPSGHAQTTFIQKNQISNDPRNWDVNWFGSYE
ncbi:MAG: hypothetical protein ACXWV0_01695 [Flavisolibacter sp.]